MFCLWFVSKLQDVEGKNQELLAEIDRLKKETEELRLRRGTAETVRHRHVFLMYREVEYEQQRVQLNMQSRYVLAKHCVLTFDCSAARLVTDYHHRKRDNHVREPDEKVFV